MKNVIHFMAAVALTLVVNSICFAVVLDGPPSASSYARHVRYTLTYTIGVEGVRIEQRIPGQAWTVLHTDTVVRGSYTVKSTVCRHG